MGKIIDLTGQKFGKLTVISKTDKRGCDRSVIWLCQCDCGNMKEVNGRDLKNGHTASCGCRKSNDLTGQKFGKLTAIQILPASFKKGTNGTYWLCQCECGNECVVASASLKTGNTQSCGCLRSKGEREIATILADNNIPFEREKVFLNFKYNDTQGTPRFDFFVNNQYVIEFDGEQHFKEAKIFTRYSLEDIQKMDKIKNNWCFTNNIPIIRIPYTKLNKITITDLLLETSDYVLKQGE